MQVKIIGKQHRKGVSKTGKNYDFISVYFNAPQSGVFGLVGQDAILDSSAYDYDAISVGCDYFIDFDRNGHVLAFNKVK